MLMCRIQSRTQTNGKKKVTEKPSIKYQSVHADVHKGKEAEGRVKVQESSRWFRLELFI